MVDDFLDADQIRAASFIRHVEIHDSLGSTNDRATELARDAEIELPALVVARRQTAGRGRGQHTWWSAEGALTFSVLFDTAAFGIDARNWPQLSLATAVAVCDALAAELGDARLGLRIKWPNDVMLDGGKACGILIESPGGATSAKGRLVIGIGINVNNSWHPAPRDAGANGIALCDITRRTHELQQILQNFLSSIHHRMKQLAANAPALPTAWQQLCWLTEQHIEAHVGNDWIDGICLGIDTDGSLIVENVFGTHRVRSGSVRVASS